MLLIACTANDNAVVAKKDDAGLEAYSCLHVDGQSPTNMEALKLAEDSIKLNRAKDKVIQMLYEQLCYGPACLNPACYAMVDSAKETAKLVEAYGKLEHNTT